MRLYIWKYLKYKPVNFRHLQIKVVKLHILSLPALFLLTLTQQRS